MRTSASGSPARSSSSTAGRLSSSFQAGTKTNVSRVSSTRKRVLLRFLSSTPSWTYRVAMTDRPTIKDVAEQAGVSIATVSRAQRQVSIATVSRVLNGRGDVSDETRDLVSRVIRENGYTANRSARGLSAGRTGFVGVVVPLVFPAYFSGLLDGAAEALFERDLQIVLSPTREEHDREVSVLDRLHGMTDGSLIILPQESSAELERHLDNGFRFVVIDPLVRLDDRIPSVSAANTSGADQAKIG